MSPKLASVKTVLIDFHTHTDASDGELSPAALLKRARVAGVTLLAFTDHDTVAGYRAALADDNVAVGLISGVEFSCCWSGTTIHIVGLGMDCDHHAMRDGLETLAQARQARGEKISQRLAGRGFHGALDGALLKAGASQLGRPHFAAWLTDCGYVADETEAFKRYLGQGKTGDVKAFWPTLAQVVNWITAAGGVAVIAHPMKYRFTRMKLRRLVVDFMAAGGEGIELLSGRQSADQTTTVLQLARAFSLEVSLGSDFHRDTAYGAPVGVELPDIRGLRGVWERWHTPSVRQEVVTT